MRKKFNCLAIWSFILCLAIYVFSYILYHHLSPDGGFTSVYQAVPAKPMVTFLFGVWGVCFHFAGVMCLLIGHIFFRDK